MSDDPLAPFRRGGTTHPTTDTVTAREAKEPYASFAGKDNNQRRARLDVRCRDGLAHLVSYNFLVEVCYDRREYTAVMLVMTTMLIKIRGRRLRPIVDALKFGTCEFVQEFDGEEFGPPDDDGAPFIDRIEIMSSTPMRQEGERKSDAN